MRPFLFNKFNNTIVGPGDPVVRPSNCRALDWEAELVHCAVPSTRVVRIRDSVSTRGPGRRDRPALL